MERPPVTPTARSLVPASVLLGVVAVLLAGSAVEREVVATVGDLEITTEDLRVAGATTGDGESVRRALRTRWSVSLLATEARTLLKLPDTLTGEQAAEALRRHLFDPAQLCSRIPEARLRQRYEETAWRFVAPPAWTVDDIQVLCCRNPRDCGTPEVQRCLEQKLAQAETLRETFDDEMSADDFKAHSANAQDTTETSFKRYVFYYKPGDGGEVHWKLQVVDAPIAEAVAALSPGGISPLITTRFGHHILRLEAMRPAIDLPWEDPRAQAILKTELCPAIVLEAETRYLKDLSRLLPIRLEATALDSAFGVEMKSIGLTGSGPR